MPIHNTEVAELFNEYADLLEINGANQYRVRAYRAAARTISNLSRSVAEMVSGDEDLSQLPGLGKDLAAKVADIVNTGQLPQLEELKDDLPAGLIDISRLEGLGPKRTGVLYQEMGITSIEQLEEAARKQEIRELPDFAARTEQKIIDAIERRERAGEGKKRYRLSVIEELAGPLLSYLRNLDGVKHVEAAGSYRRRKETVGDLDILVTHKRRADVMKPFVEYDDVERIISKGDTRSSVVLRFGVHVDLRAVAEGSYGAALHYFTGSQPHNIAIRKMGVERGLKINEYGVFRDDKRIAGRTEDEVYDQVDLPYIEPELRENTGEIEAAQKGELPELVTLDDIRGDLHSHTKATDGRSSLAEMAAAARERGYEYLAITEHSRHLTVARGLDVERLEKQLDEIDRLNEELDGIVLIKGIEVDVLEDGSVDLPDDILGRLDIVVFAVHYKLGLPADKQTQRIIKGIDNPYFTILTHPTGRLIGQREPYHLNMEELMQAAKETGCVLEINAQPDRLDLADVHARMAREMGIMMAVSTDAHSVDELDFMRFGVDQARRGWLESGDVLNTRSWKDLKKLIGKQ